MTDPTPDNAAHPVGSTARETLARVIWESEAPSWASDFSVQVEALKKPRLVLADAILAHLTSDEAIERAAVAIEAHDESQPSGAFNVHEDNKSKSHKAILAALGEVE